LRRSSEQIKAGGTMHLRFLLIPALALSACTASAPPAKPPLEGARIGGAFALTDQNGQTGTEQAFDGKFRIMYFGYTFCPDVCPTDVQAIGAAVKKLETSDPALAAKTVPVFVTVDPARDTPAVLKQFVSAFHPRMVGLTGTDA
jgi:protein SCO1/2